MSESTSGHNSAEQQDTKAESLHRLKNLFRSIQKTRRLSDERRSEAEDILDVLEVYPEFCLEHFKLYDPKWRIKTVAGTDNQANGGDNEILDDAEEEDEEEERKHASDTRAAQFTPLAFFVALELSLLLIDDVCKLNPKALLDDNKDTHLCPLQISCVMQTYHRVTIFLARECPKTLSRKDSNGRYPVQLALAPGSGSGFETQAYKAQAIAPMIELFPDALDGHSDRYGNTALGLGIRLNFSAKVLRLLVERIPKSLEELSLYQQPQIFRDGTRLHETHVQEIAKLLPQLKKLNIRCRWTREGLVRLLECLQQNQQQEETVANTNNRCSYVSLTLPFLMISACHHLQTLLTGCAHGLQSLALFQCSRDDDSISHEKILRSVVSASKPPFEVEVLSLKLPTVQVLDELLSSGSAPRKLTIRGLQILSTDIDSRIDIANSNNSPLEYLNLGVSTWNTASRSVEKTKEDDLCIENLVNRLAQLPKLRELHLRIRQVYGGGRRRSRALLSAPLEDSLENLIATAPSLVSLTLRNFDCCAESALRALRQNTRLKFLSMSTLQDPTTIHEQFLDLVRNDNVTLDQLWVGKGEPNLLELYVLPPKLLHYLTLNKWGRAQARTPDTTIGQLVQLLSAVPAGTQQVSIHYGLLRELPVLWCGNSSVTGKRKRVE